MIKLLKDTFFILNRNFWLLFIFMTISYFCIVYFSILRSAANTPLEIIIGVITLLLLVTVGVAGFFFSLTSTINAEYSEKLAPRIELLKTFPKGVSEYFLSALGIVLIYLLITSLVFGGTVLLGKYLIGDFSFSAKELANAMNSVEALNEFQKNIPVEDWVKLSKWHLLYLIVSSILTYLFIYWLPETFFKTKNPIVSLWGSLKKVFLNPIKTFKLFIALVIINIVTSLIMALIMPIPFLAFLVYLLYFYSFLYILLLTFVYYRSIYVETTQAIVENTEKEEEINEGNEE